MVAVSVFRRFDGSGGSDYPGHLDYLRYIDFTASVPAADRGWQMYHPPAYYAVSALAFEALHRLGSDLSLATAGRGIAAAGWAAEGLLAVFAVRAAGGGWLAAGVASILAWLLPGQSIAGSMLYQETFTGTGIGLLVAGVSVAGRRPRLAALCLGAGFAMASLSKFSGLPPALVGGSLGAWALRRRPGLAAAGLLPAAALAALFYGRNLLLFHTPTPLNADLFDLRRWDPLPFGYPSHYFTTLHLSGCAARTSFWGGVWKWFWTDDCFQMPWTQHVRGVYLVAAVMASIAVAAALIWAAVAWRGRPALLACAAAPAALGGAFLVYALRVPSQTTPRGLYLMAGIVPVAVATGLFAERLAVRRWIAGAGYAAALLWGLEMARVTVLA